MVTRNAKVRAKRISWGCGHYDAYVFNPNLNAWVWALCVVGPDPGMRCTAPPVLPRGTRFDGTVMIPQLLAELALAREA
jgi:hypothetical protein